MNQKLLLIFLLSVVLVTVNGLPVSEKKKSSIGRRISSVKSGSKDKGNVAEGVVSKGKRVNNYLNGGYWPGGYSDYRYYPWPGSFRDAYSGHNGPANNFYSGYKSHENPDNLRNNFRLYGDKFGDKIEDKFEDKYGDKWGNVGGIKLGDYWSTIADNFSGYTPYGYKKGDKGGNIGDTIQGIGFGIEHKIGSLGTGLKDTVGQFGDKFTGIGVGIGDKVVEIGTGVKDKFEDFGHGLGDFLHNGFGGSGGYAYGHNGYGSFEPGHGFYF